jgi:osmoprotectant transport system permease protein
MTTLAVLGQFGDAIDFIFHTRESRAGGSAVGGGENLPLLWEHLKVCGLAMAIAIAVGLPTGLVLGHTGRGSFAAISVSNVGRAVPSVALIALAYAFLPRAPEFLIVVLALALLAIPPILTNAYVGVQQTDRDTVDAARGMGLSGRQLIREIELPLALPLIFGGIKTSTVNVIATATIAPLIGVVTLGDPIISGSVYGRDGQIGASIMVAALAVKLERGEAPARRIRLPRNSDRRVQTAP